MWGRWQGSGSRLIDDCWDETRKDALACAALLH